MTVIDTHTHAFPDTLARRAIETLQAEVRGCGLGLPDTAYTDGTAKGLCDIMDRGGAAGAHADSLRGGVPRGGCREGT